MNKILVFFLFFFRFLQKIRNKMFWQTTVTIRVPLAAKKREGDKRVKADKCLLVIFKF